MVPLYVTSDKVSFKFQYQIHLVTLIFTFRNRIFFGQTVKTFLQKPGETLYMPNLIFHSVWNMSPTIAVGDNPLYDSSFIEHLGSGTFGTNIRVKDMISRLTSDVFGESVSNVKQQMNAAIKLHNVLRYKNPRLWMSEASVCNMYSS